MENSVRNGSVRDGQHRTADAVIVPHPAIQKTPELVGKDLGQGICLYCDFRIRHPGVERDVWGALVKSTGVTCGTRLAIDVTVTGVRWGLRAVLRAVHLRFDRIQKNSE